MVSSKWNNKEDHLLYEDQEILNTVVRSTKFSHVVTVTCKIRSPSFNIEKILLIFVKKKIKKKQKKKESMLLIVRRKD